MFRTLPEDPRAGDSAPSSPVDIVVDGKTVAARAGDSVALALLAGGVLVHRATPVSGAPRGPFCLMGVCFDCLVTIDGVPNRQGCMVPVRPGMRIETRRAATSFDGDGR